MLRAGSVVPNDLGDPLLNVWLLDWNARVLPLTPAWWNAPQFYPLAGVTAFSEHLLGLSPFTTPIVLATGNPLLAYNAAFLLSFFLSAVGGHLLGYALTRRHDAALVAGIAFGFAPYRMGQLAHVQVLSAYWMPAGLAALHWYRETGRRRWAVAFAAAWTLQALTCGYYLFYFSVLAGAWLFWFRGGRRQGHYRVLLAAWAAASVVLVPVAYGYLHFQHAYRLGRGIDEIKSLSADVASVLKAPEYLRVWGALDVYGRAESDLFPGLTLVLVVAAAVVTAWARQPAVEASRRRRIVVRVLGVVAAICAAVAVSPLVVGPWSLVIGGAKILSVTESHKPFTLAVVLLTALVAANPVVRSAWQHSSPLAFYTLAAILMWAFALGPEPTLFGEPVLYKAPYWWLMQLPGVHGIRVPARFWMLAALCLSAAASVAAARWRVDRAGAPFVAAGLVCVAMLVEAWPRPVPLMPPPEAHPARSNAVARLELPMSPTDDPRALFRAAGHRLPLLNGYSGYFSPHYWILHDLLKRRTPGVLPELGRLGPLEIVVEHAFDPGDAWRAWLRGSPGVTEIHVAETYSTYLVERVDAPATRAETGEALPIADVMPGAGQPSVLAATTDGNLVTRWHVAGETGVPATLLVDLGTPAEIRAVVLELGGYVADYPGELRVDTSDDGHAWDTAWSGYPGVQALRGALEQPLVIPIRLDLPARRARWLRIQETAGDRVHPWSVAEVRVLGAR